MRNIRITLQGVPIGAFQEIKDDENPPIDVTISGDMINSVNSDGYTNSSYGRRGPSLGKNFMS